LANGHISLLPRPAPIISQSGLEVCDAGHTWFVMKKAGRQIADFVMFCYVPFVVQQYRNAIEDGW
jgi:hypothetical protein